MRRINYFVKIYLYFDYKINDYKCKSTLVDNKLRSNGIYIIHYCRHNFISLYIEMIKHNSCILNCEMDHVKVPEHLLTKLG